MNYIEWFSYSFQIHINKTPVFAHNVIIAIIFPKNLVIQSITKNPDFKFIFNTFTKVYTLIWLREANFFMSYLFFMANIVKSTFFRPLEVNSTLLFSLLTTVHHQRILFKVYLTSGDGVLSISPSPSPPKHVVARILFLHDIMAKCFYIAPVPE